MRNNENYYSRLDESCCTVCENKVCNCPKTCGEKAKAEWEEYMEKERCKPEEFEPFNPCDFDWNDIYFLQYRSKYAQYDSDGYYKIFDKTFDKTFE